MCVLWDSLTAENRNDLERTQKTFCKLVLEEDYRNYNQALDFLQIQTLEDRRKELTLKFAEVGILSGALSDLFHRKRKAHTMKTRKGDYYKQTYANTMRLQNSPLLAMQRMLNRKQKNNDT